MFDTDQSIEHRRNAFDRARVIGINFYNSRDPSESKKARTYNPV
jgi:hypothetical protein